MAMGIGVVLVGIGGIGALLLMRHPSHNARIIWNLQIGRIASFLKKGIGAGELAAIIILRRVSELPATQKQLSS